MFFWSTTRESAAVAQRRAHKIKNYWISESPVVVKAEKDRPRRIRCSQTTAIIGSKRAIKHSVVSFRQTFNEVESNAMQRGKSIYVNGWHASTRIGFGLKQGTVMPETCIQIINLTSGSSRRQPKKPNLTCPNNSCPCKPRLDGRWN